MPGFIRNYSFRHKSVFYPRKGRDSISIREKDIPPRLNSLNLIRTSLIHAGLFRQERKAAAPAGHLRASLQSLDMDFFSLLRYNTCESRSAFNEYRLSVTENHS